MESYRVLYTLLEQSANRKSPKDAPWETLNQNNSVGQFLQTPDIGQGTCRVPANP